jgi:hypothetical protein
MQYMIFHFRQKLCDENYLFDFDSYWNLFMELVAKICMKINRNEYIYIFT